MDQVNKRKRGKSSGKSSSKKSKSIKHNVTLPHLDDASSTGSVPASFNLSGRPKFNRSSTIKQIKVKNQGVYHPGSLATDPYWSFHVHSTKDEWIRLNPDSISAVIYGKFNKEANAAAAAGTLEASTSSALLARSRNPILFVDPTVAGASFVKGVQVWINNTQVFTNDYNRHPLHYIRANRIFNARPSLHWKKTQTLGLQLEQQEMTCLLS